MIEHYADVRNDFFLGEKASADGDQSDSFNSRAIWSTRTTRYLVSPRPTRRSPSGAPL
jgi:hypothetical protein